MKGKHHMGHHAHRKHHKHGGLVGNVAQEGDIAHDEAPHEVYAGAGSNVVKEAMKKKRGGKVHHAHKEVEAHGHHAHHRLDRPKRKSGGKVGGAEMHPFSAAHHVKSPAGRDVDAGES